MSQRILIGRLVGRLDWKSMRAIASSCIWAASPKIGRWSRGNHSMQPEHRTPLLGPGHEREWAQINAEEQAQLDASNLALSVVQRLEVGQRLSQEAVSMLVAGYRAGLVPRASPLGLISSAWWQPRMRPVCRMS